ncbi:MAG: hypothetical protein IPH09_16315 [bacterium]|nr:hypothetical protein [bacterium]
MLPTWSRKVAAYWPPPWAVMAVATNAPAPTRDQHQTPATDPSLSVTVAVTVTSSPSEGAAGRAGPTR